MAIIFYRLPVRAPTINVAVVVAFPVAPPDATKTITIETMPWVEGFHEQVATFDPFVGRFLQPAITFPRS
jgi:hypothetical protein